MARYTSCSETLGFYVILPCPCDVHTDRAGAASAAVRQQLLSGKDPQRSQRLPEARQHDFCECYILLIPGITWDYLGLMEGDEGNERYIKFNFGRPRAFHCWPVLLQPSYA